MSGLNTHQSQEIISSFYADRETIFDNANEFSNLDREQQQELVNAINQIKTETKQRLENINIYITDEELQNELMKFFTAKQIDIRAVEAAFKGERTTLQTDQINHNTTTLPQSEATQMINTSNEAYQKTQQETTYTIQNSQEELNNMTNDLITQLKNDIHITKKHVRFAARGEGKDVREVKKYIITRLNKADQRLNKFNKTKQKRGEDVIKSEHEIAMFMKIVTLLNNSKDYVSQAITGDIDEAKKFFPPNVFNDGSLYIPDKKPGQNTKNKQNYPDRYYTSTPDQQKLYRECVEQTGSKNSGVKAIGKMIDEKVSPRLDENVTNGKGTRVITGAMKTGLLVANGIMLWNMGKNLFNLVFKKGDKGKYFGKFLLNAGFFTALNFVDPDKALGSLKDTRGRISGNKPGTVNKPADLSTALNTISDKNVSEEEKITVHGSMITGLGLGGITYGEATTSGVFTQEGNKIIGINTTNLKQFYEKKYINDTKQRNELLEYVNTIEKMNKINPALLKEIMSYHNITTDKLEDPQYKNILIGTHFGEEVRQAINTIDALSYTSIRNKLETTDPTIENTLGTENYKNLLDNIMQLPNNMQQEIIDGKIIFSIQDGKLMMSTSGETGSIDISTRKLSLKNQSGELVEFSIGETSTGGIVSVLYHTLNAINNHKGKFMIDKPFFHAKKYGERGNKILGTIGAKRLTDPTSYKNGRTVTILDAGRRYSSGDSGLDKFKDENVMEQYADYLNELGIRKGENADNYIQTTLTDRIKEQYPDPQYNDADRQAILTSLLGEYPDRGTRDPFFRTTGDKLTGKVKENYDAIKNIFGNGRNDVKRLGKKVVYRTIDAGVLMVDLGNGVMVNFRDQLESLVGPGGHVTQMRNAYNIRANSKLLPGVENAADQTKNKLHEAKEFILGLSLFGPQTQQSQNQPTP